jgi:MFS family permease
VAEDRSTFSSLRYPEYRRLWISGLVVFMGVNAQGIARGWLARELTGTNAGLGGVLLAFGVAMLLATPFGGVAADRFPKRTVLLVSEVLLVGTACWIGFAVQLDFIAYWMLLAASAIQAVAFAMYGPARMAFMAELVEGDDLGNAIVLGEMSSESMRIVGPTVAGILIAAATWGLASVFLGGAVLLAVATVLTIFLPAGRTGAGRPQLSPIAEMVEGIRYVRQRDDLSLLVLGSLAVVMFAYPYLAFLPTVADGMFHRGSSGYGLLSAASAVGAVTAGFFSARTSHRLDPWTVVIVGGFGFGGGVVLLGLAPHFVVALLFVAITGSMSLTFTTTLQTLLLGLSEFEYHGRMQSLVMLGFSGFGIAALPLGILADHVGLRLTFVGMGASAAAVMAVFLVRRGRIRERELALDLG